MKRKSLEMIKDMDYIKTLNKADKAWLFKAVSGMTNANHKFLSQISPENADAVYISSYEANNAASRDIINKAQRVDSATSGDEENGFYHLLSTEGHYMTTFEDAIIDKVDAERMGKPYKATSYGNNEQVPIGAEVVICIEGHALQNKLGKVTAIRRGQYLVRAQTGKGDVEVYVSAHEIARVNSMKQVG